MAEVIEPLIFRVIWLVPVKVVQIAPIFLRGPSLLHASTLCRWDPVNKWVAKQTQGHITDLMQGRPDPLMVAALVNAVFFKGNWSSQFDPKNTAPGTFTTTDGTQLPARFMKKSGKMHVAQVWQSLSFGSRLQRAPVPKAQTLLEEPAFSWLVDDCCYRQPAPLPPPGNHQPPPGNPQPQSFEPQTRALHFRGTGQCPGPNSVRKRYTLAHVAYSQSESLSHWGG